MQDMNNLFESIKHHITNATQQLSGDLQQVVDSNSKFKQEVQDELQEMRQFLAEQKRLLGLQSSSDVTMVPTISPVTLPSVSSVPSMQNVAPPVVPQSVQSSTLDSTHASQDINAQMLLLLTDSFSKYPQH
jgi:vacuolar-type H+-ATPase subunit D/Vma8